MNSAILAVLVLTAFFFGYRFYSRFISEKIFALHKEAGKTPAEALRDNVDFMPAKRPVLFGHHFSSIAGAAPIVGPAVAVIWGWVPAIIWIVVGAVFMGAVHDLGVLYLSLKHKGQSIGQLSREVIGPRVTSLFLVVIFFLLWMVIAVFALVIANLFVSYPSSVLPVNFEILVAVAIGFLINRRNKPLLWPSIIAQAMLWGMIFMGTFLPVSLEGLFGENQILVWISFLMIYSFVASSLPVWVLLQPRDYINCHKLFLGLGALLLGLFITQPPVVAPAFNPSPVGAPPWFPFLFITIACGAISGFHGLVGSGTTSKQVGKWSDLRPVGYGGMLGEGTLALLATLAVCAGIGTVGDWHSHYADWNSANGLSAKLNAFVSGSSHFLGGLGIPTEIGSTIIAVIIISFAATSLDTAARIQRLIIAEMGQTFKIPVLKNRFVAAGIAVGSAWALMVMKSGGKGGLLIWPLFGATNQMMAALALLLLSVFLLKKKKNPLPFSIPLIFMIFMTALGLLLNIRIYVHDQSWGLAIIASILVVIQIWMVFEAFFAIRSRLAR